MPMFNAVRTSIYKLNYGRIQYNLTTAYSFYTQKNDTL